MRMLGLGFTATAAAITAAAISTAALAGPIEEVLTPQTYFQCQIAAQQATIVGLQERAQQAGKQLSEADKQIAADKSQARVTVALHGCGKQSAATLGAYAHRNADQLQTYLNANPQVKAQMDALTKRIQSLSQQMPAISPSAKR